jgi:hypothetical protein
MCQATGRLGERYHTGDFRSSLLLLFFNEYTWSQMTFHINSLIFYEILIDLRRLLGHYDFLTPAKEYSRIRVSR